MKFKKSKVFPLATIFCGFLLSSCFWPQDFVAEIMISDDGTFLAKYNGELVQSKDEPLAFILLSEIQDFSQFENISGSSKKVNYEKSGSVIKQAYKFPPKVDTQGGGHFFEIIRYDNGNLSLHGFMDEYEQGRQDIEKYTNGSYNLTGVLKVIVDGNVVAHNADRVSEDNEYIWVYDDPDKPKNPELIVSCADKGENFCVGATNAAVEGLNHEG